jgi:hypothetical protein
MELRFAILRQSRDTVPFLEIFLQYCLISGPRPPMQPGRWPIDLIGQRMGGGGKRGEMARFSDREMFPNGGRDWLYRIGQHDRNFVILKVHDGAYIF